MANESGLERFYYKIWHDWCRQKQPFTYSVRDEQKANPLLFLLVFAGLGIFVGLKCRKYWWQLLIGFLLGIIAGHFWW